MKFAVVTFFILSLLFLITAGYIIWVFPPKIDGQLAVSNVIYVLISGFFGLAFFSISIHYFLVGMFKSRKKLLEQSASTKRSFLESVRRGFLFSGLSFLLITLNIFDLLNILNASLVIGIVILAEIYFSSR